jgi:hypothetical protein
LEKVPWADEKSVYSTTVGGIFFRCLLSPFDLLCHLILTFSCWVFSSGWPIYLGEWDTKVIPYYCVGRGTVLLCTVCFMKFSMPVFSTYTFRMVITSSWAVPFTHMKWPSLSLLFCFEVFFVSCEYNYFCFLSGSICWNNFYHPFTLSLCLSWPVRCISYRQQMVGSCFLIQFCQCLLIENRDL